LEISSLVHDLKMTLISNCDLKPCGYALDDIDDVEVTNTNTLDFYVQGDTVG
jgi:hypothetical protein